MSSECWDLTILTESWKKKKKWIWLCLPVRPSICWFNLTICPLVCNAILRNVHQFFLIFSDLFMLSTFVLVYEITYGLLPYRKNWMSEKNLEIWPKNHWANQDARFFKLQYLTNMLRYELTWIFVCGQASIKQEIYSVILSWCGQSCQGMPKVKQNDKLA